MIELLYELWEYLFEESRGTFDFLVPPNEAIKDTLFPQVFSLSELPMCDNMLSFLIGKFRSCLSLLPLHIFNLFLHGYDCLRGC